MPTLHPQDFIDRVGAQQRLIAKSVQIAFAKYLELVKAMGGQFGHSLTSRTRAGILHDYVIEDATERLPFNHLVSNGVHLWQVDDLAFRFRKLDDNSGLPSNVSTNHNDALCNSGEHPTIFEDIKPSYLTVGYDVTSDWTRLGDVWVMYLTDERRLSWTIPVSVDGKAIPMDQVIPGIVAAKPRSKIGNKDFRKRKEA